jgi:hypothetical protein
MDYLQFLIKLTNVFYRYIDFNQIILFKVHFRLLKNHFKYFYCHEN